MLISLYYKKYLAALLINVAHFLFSTPQSFLDANWNANIQQRMTIHHLNVFVVCRFVDLVNKHSI